MKLTASPAKRIAMDDAVDAKNALQTTLVELGEKMGMGQREGLSIRSSFSGTTCGELFKQVVSSMIAPTEEKDQPRGILGFVFHPKKKIRSENYTTYPELNVSLLL